MCLRDLINQLQNRGVVVSETQVRWAIVSRKIDRPMLDGSLRFDFQKHHLRQLLDLFSKKGAG